jgi:hypothetical protein
MPHVPPRQPPRPTAKPRSFTLPDLPLPSEHPTQKEVLHLLYTLVMSDKHNWKLAGEWLERLWNQNAEILERLGAVEEKHGLPAMREKLPSVRELEHFVERVEAATGSGTPKSLNSDRVREVARTVVIEHEHAELTEEQKESRRFRHQIIGGVLIAIILAVLGFTAGRILPH